MVECGSRALAPHRKATNPVRDLLPDEVYVGLLAPSEHPITQTSACVRKMLQIFPRTFLVLSLINNFDITAFASLNMGLAPSFRPDIVAFLNPALCANTEQQADGKDSLCQNAASLVCVCKLVQVRCLHFSKDAPLRLVLRKSHLHHV